MATSVFRSIKNRVNKTRWYKKLFDWCMHDNWWVGRYVELKGNQVVIDDCVFKVGNPEISTRLKSRFVLDQYEGAERHMIRQYLDPTLPAIELGASIGVVSCITNRRLNNPRQHVVVEANPALMSLLMANRNLNQCQFTALNRAYAYGKKSVSLYLDEEFVKSTVCQVSGKAVEVAAISLKDILEEAGFRRCTLLCDIEGAEFDVLRNECTLLAERVAMLIIELHQSADTGDTIATAIDKLCAAGFVQLAQRSRVYVFRNSSLS